ncbi:MAG: DUF58 domain-containing protein [Acidimicrobiales bacterium]
MSRRVRPTRPLAPIAVAIGVLGIWWLVAHYGGAGWVQALGDLAFGTICVGIAGPSVVLARAKVTVASAPTDGIAGQPVEIRLAASTRLRVRPVEPCGEEAFIGPVGGSRPPDDRITLRPEHRGVCGVLILDIASAAPFALQWWTRRVVLPLPTALHIAPRRGRPQSLPVRDHEESGAAADWVQSDVGQPRGARPYRSGDSRRQVHWRATAHAGELMVRELERPSAEPVTLRVVLPGDAEEAERVAERALGTVVGLLDRGASVVLATVEASGPVVAGVADRRGAGRRLARAVAHPAGPGPGAPAGGAPTS